MAKADRTPRRFTGRAGGRIAGVGRRLGRLMEGAVDTSRTYGDGLDVARDGRLDVRIAKGSVLRMTSRGLDIDPQQLGDKNLAQMDHIADVASGATTAEVASKLNELLSELRRTKRTRGGF